MDETTARRTLTRHLPAYDFSYTLATVYDVSYREKHTKLAEVAQDVKKPLSVTDRQGLFNDAFKPIRRPIAPTG